MSLRMMTPLCARIAQTLKDYLPAELDLIDTEEADSITTPNIPNGNYYTWDRRVVPEFPAVTMRTVSSQPAAGRGVGIRQAQMGERADVTHRIEIMFHATIETATGSGAAGNEEIILQSLMHRYINGAMRVLCVTKEGLQTSADPVYFDSPTATTICEWFDPATYGPLEVQDDGVMVRTATLPIHVRRIEAR